jgi:hypothetical protein
MYLIRRREWRIAFYASVGEPFQILAAMALKIAFRREHRGRTNQHNTAAQQASRACVLRLCIIQVLPRINVNSIDISLYYQYYKKELEMTRGPLSYNSVVAI